MIHDAVRPNIKNNTINLVLEKLDYYKAVIPVIEITDSVKNISENFINKHINRKNLALAQTPQGFRYIDILAKHNRSKKKKFNR